MRATILAVIAIAISPISMASQVCAFPGTTYKVTRDLQLKLEPPSSDTPLVAWTTDTSFVLYAKQSDFVDIAKALGAKQANQQDIHDLYRWIESKMPASVILLDEFDADHSGKRRQFLMQLATERKIFISAEPSGEYLPFATVEWFACSYGEHGEYGESGGRRIRKGNGVTIHLTWDWIA